MGRKKYVLSGRPKMARANDSGCVQVSGQGKPVQKPSDYNLNFRFVKQINLNKLKPSRITPQERRQILAAENADIRR